MDNKFYIYEFIRLDTYEPFYIGKGCGNRVNDIHRGRSEWFKNIIKRHGAASRIIMNNLSEQEAYEGEVWFIYEYKHILNYDLVNLDDGGIGATSGESNPMYGKKGELSPIFGRKATSERRARISKSLKGKKKTSKHIKNLITARSKIDISGCKNPNYGNGKAIAGGKNPSAQKILVTTNLNEKIIFETKNEACEKYGISKYLLTKLLGKRIDVVSDFSRENDRYKHLDQYKFELFNEGLTTIETTSY